MSNTKVWFVTGASKGLGRILVLQLLQQGYKVAATSRNIADLRKITTADSSSFLPLAVDLISEKSVEDAIGETVKHFGRIDVIVNNAGYGQVGGLEEVSDTEARTNFDVNVFGSLNVIRKALPYLREQKSGHILNISSIAGFVAFFPGFGIYCATKFALEGLSESLVTEVKPFGIHVTLVEPGYFRTEFLSSGSLAVPANEIADYENIREVQKAHQFDIHGQQAGDPEKAAAAMIQVTTTPEPPVHLFLGQDAYDLAYEKIATVKKDLEAWKAVTVATGF
ncbi:oxidoreductase [Chitinophaga nivalis]|uniref:Oxidoreductase n=1 Tax=Chitinophaga nivalis TaxID=2991709 RepID=A0ABT3IGK3_9BACT|nr:oxidoreductase [Chitinophaga nivalis]MCW3467221.1 oxidoreductase [Chitinophaga nivalis]MCW3483087.1 oxidoreductase [Chitinophaga nivalis]